MNAALRDLADIASGYQFRGKIPDISDGSVHAVQMKNVDSLVGIDWIGVTRTELPRSDPDSWLEDGDLLFAARGSNNYAVAVSGCPPRTVVSPHFFHLRIKAEASIIPEFLAWQINQAPMQRFFRASAEGSDVVGIRKAVLDSARVVVPSMERQKKIVEMINCWSEERAVIEALARSHEDLMAAVAEDILSENAEGVR